MKDNILTVLVAIAIAALITFVSVSITGKDDEPLEEFAEDVLKLETGVDIDLTPNSPENNEK